MRRCIFLGGFSSLIDQHLCCQVSVSASPRFFSGAAHPTTPTLQSKVERKLHRRESFLSSQKKHKRNSSSSAFATRHVYDVTAEALGLSKSSSSTPSNLKNLFAGRSGLTASTEPSLPPLKCPGGPRVKAEGIKHLYKVPHAGYLAKYDQRFVLNLKLTHQLVSYLSRTTLLTPDKVIIELGPGVGSLTRSLLTRPCVGILGIEQDTRFNPHLEQIKSYTNGKFQWLNADVLQVNELEVLTALFPDFVRANIRRPPDGGASQQQSKQSGSGAAGKSHYPDDSPGFEGAPLRSSARERLLRQRRAKHGSRAGAANEPFSTSPNPAFDVTDHWWADGYAKVEVVANLPFEIITELLMRYATDCSRHSGLFLFGRVPVHVFTQQEVAERMVAPPGSIHYSRLSVLCQSYFHVRLKQTFVEQTFYPRTEVNGAMLTLEPRTVPLTAAELDAGTLIHFTDLFMKPGHRGDTVHKSLSRFCPEELVHYVLQELKVDGAMTVLDLSVEEVAKLASLWHRFLVASQQNEEKKV